MFCVRFDEFVDHGGHRGNTVQALARWRHPVASIEALDVLAPHCALYRHTRMMIKTTSDPPAFIVIVHMSLWIVTARKLWMSHDRGGWGLILQCYECMLMHIWILGCRFSIRCLWYGLNSWECLVGSPKGTFWGFLFGSWSLPMISWNLEVILRAIALM